MLFAAAVPFSDTVLIIRGGITGGGAGTVPDFFEQLPINTIGNKDIKKYFLSIVPSDAC